MTDQKKGLGLVFATAFISGFAIFINKLNVDIVDPYFYTFVKNLAAAGLLFGLLFLTKNWQSVKVLTRQEKIKLILIGLVGGAIPFLLFFKGLTLTAAFKAGFIHKTLFIYVGLLALLFLKEKISKSLLAGFASLVLGSFLILKVKSQALNIGDLYVFLAVLLWSLEIIISKKVLETVSGTLVGTARLFIGSIFIFLFLIFTGRGEVFGTLNPSILIWTLISGLILAAYNWTFYNGLKYIKASEATAILTLGMPITVILTAVFLEASISGQELLGIGLILIGAVLASETAKSLVAARFEKINERS